MPELDESPLETPSVEVLTQRLLDGVQLDCTILYLTYLGPQAKKAAPAIFQFLSNAPTDLHSTLVAKLVGRWGIASIYDLYHAGGDRMTPFVAYALVEVRERDAFDRLLRGLTTGAPLPKAFSHAVLRELVLNDVDQRVDAGARPHVYGERGIVVQPLDPTFLRCLDASDCVFRSLSAFVIGLVSDAEKQKAVEPLRRALAHADADVRFAAAISLAILGDKTVKPHLVDALQHGETDARRFAAAILVKQDPPAPQLAFALKDADRATRSIAAHAFIGKQAPPVEALPVFREMLGDSNHEFAAADGLAKAAPASVPFLVDALQDRNPDVRSMAAWAISFIRDESSRKALLPRLVERIGDSDAKVRKSVIDSIADLASPGTPDIVGPLLPLLEMPDLRGNAARALSRVGRGDARVPALLVARARSKDAAIARDGAVALTALAPLSDDELDAISAALSVDQTFSKKARQSEFHWLGPIGSQLIVYWSKTALQADDAAAQRAAGLLIARSEERALSTFITIFKDPARRRRGTAFIRQWVASLGSSTFDNEILLRRRALAESLTEILKLGDWPSRSAAARLLAVTHQEQHIDYRMCRQEFDSEDDVEPTLTLLSWQQRVEPVLQRLVTEGVDSGDRAAAAVLLRAMGVSNEAVHDALVAALDDPEPFIRLFAAATVIHVRPGNRAALNLILQEQSHGKLYDICLKQAVEPMPKEIKAPTLDAWHELLAASHDDAFRLTAASQLIKVDPASTLARQVLVEFARRQNERALAALMQSGTAGIESIDYLIGKLTDIQWKEKAIEALARIGDPTFDPLLRVALDGSDAAASALGAVFNAPSLPRLEALLDDPKTIRIGIRALETAGEAAAPAVAKLRTIMLSGSPHANAAAWALTEITPDSRDALPYQCRSIAQRDSFPDVRFGKTLARFGVDGVVELAAAVRSSGLSERDAVACVHDAIVFGENANAEALKKGASNSAVTAAVRTLIARAMEK
jgi:HEAT repeat protein